jgi:hypothetical protein
MAQTKRKRQTKHRGNAAGVVESRGRTGRKPTAAEKKGPQDAAAARAKTKPVDKRDLPPTWRGAFYKAMIATVLLLVVMLVFLKQSATAIGVFPIILAGYTVVSYFTDKFVYDRRQKKKLREGKAQVR